MKPVRIQRSRQYKMVSPNGLPIVYVGRPTKWGNPYALDKYLLADSLLFYQDDIFNDLYKEDEIKKELKGKNLACFCPLNKPCHADILLKIANSE